MLAAAVSSGSESAVVASLRAIDVNAVDEFDVVLSSFNSSSSSTIVVVDDVVVVVVVVVDVVVDVVVEVAAANVGQNVAGSTNAAKQSLFTTKENKLKRQTCFFFTSHDSCL